MQEFAIRAEETIDAQKHILTKEAGEELRLQEQSTQTLVKNVESKVAESEL